MSQQKNSKEARNNAMKRELTITIKRVELEIEICEETASNTDFDITPAQKELYDSLCVVRDYFKDLRRDM